MKGFENLKKPSKIEETFFSGRGSNPCHLNAVLLRAYPGRNFLSIFEGFFKVLSLLSNSPNF